ncbi:hypothetical protein ULF88_15120 [Halopseudomonas pachastrellae]|nr:hypothetical protein [Halopseudomonas pachastrellae]
MNVKGFTPFIALLSNLPNANMGSFGQRCGAVGPGTDASIIWLSCIGHLLSWRFHSSHGRVQQMSKAPANMPDNPDGFTRNSVPAQNDA